MTSVVQMYLMISATRQLLLHYIKKKIETEIISIFKMNFFVLHVQLYLFIESYTDMINQKIKS